jgi:hypothetical protein
MQAMLLGHNSTRSRWFQHRMSARLYLIGNALRRSGGDYRWLMQGVLGVGEPAVL